MSAGRGVQPRFRGACGRRAYVATGALGGRRNDERLCRHPGAGAEVRLTLRPLLEKSNSAAPGAFVLLFVIAERLLEAAQHLGGSLEHRLQLRFVYLLDVFPQVIHRLLQALLHLLGVVAWIAICFADHPGFLSLPVQVALGGVMQDVKPNEAEEEFLMFHLLTIPKLASLSNLDIGNRLYNGSFAMQPDRRDRRVMPSIG